MILDSIVEDDIPVLYDLLAQVEPHTDDEHRVFNDLMDELDSYVQDTNRSNRMY